MSWKFSNTLRLPDFYKYYVNSIEKKSIYHVKISTFGNIIRAGNAMYIDALFNGASIRPFAGLGVFQLVKYVPRKQTMGGNIDWAYYNKHKVIRKLSNDHCGGYRFLVEWIRARTNNSLKSFRIDLTDGTKNKLRDRIFNGGDAPLKRKRTRRIK